MMFDGRAPRPFLISAWPDVVRTQFDESRDYARREYLAGRVDQAVAELTIAYERLVSQQPAGHRYHKGEPLYQLGLWALEKREGEEARHRIQAAFIEDVLSRGEESPELWDELGRPAALTLASRFGLGSRLLDFTRRLREAQASGRLFLEPDEALEAVPIEASAETPSERDAAPFVADDPEVFPFEWRELGSFGTPLERRVFIGGSYADDSVLSVLTVARDEARRCGWDGVLVAEFKAPEGTDMRRKSLVCLMSCCRAIFDLSVSGGHQVEFDKLQDFGVRPVLVVYNAQVEDRLRISSLTQARFPDLQVQTQGYRGLSELRQIVREWLARA